MNSASRTAVYPQNSALVADAYREAMREVGAEIVAESGTTFTGVVRQGNQDVQIHSSILHREGGAEASVSFEYRMDYRRFVHYAHEIETAATRMLAAESSVRRIPEYIFPEDIDSCLLTDVVGNRSKRPPSFVDGPEAIERTLGYHPAAAEAGIEGAVYVYAVIGVEGRVTCAEVLSGLPHGLNQNAVAAVMRTRFNPATVGDRAVPAGYLFPVIFRIERR